MTIARRFLLIFSVLLSSVALSSCYDANNQPPKTYGHNRIGLMPLMSPENSLYELQRLLDSAQRTLLIENQYIQKFDDQKPWLEDGNPLMQSIILAKNRGVQVRVILESTSDSDLAAPFLKKAGVPVRFLKTDLYLHNKAVIVDGVTTSISSINWSGTSLQKNRESGVICFNATDIAAYYTEAFEYDWRTGAEVTGTVPDRVLSTFAKAVVAPPVSPFPVFNVSINVTTFVNPDLNAANALVMRYFASAKIYIHAEIYSITSRTFADAITSSISRNKLKDVSIMVSRQRVGFYDFSLTNDNINRLLAGGANVYNSSSSFRYQHAKFWIIDGEHLFIHSGNWALTSLTPSTSNDANRDFGLIIHDRCVAEWFERNIFQTDLKIAAGQFAPATCALSSFDRCSVCGGSGDSCVPESLAFDACGYCPASYPAYSAAACAANSNDGIGSGGASAGAVAAAVIVTLLVVAAIVVGLFFLHKTGRLATIKAQISAKFSSAGSTADSSTNYQLFTKT